MDLKEHLIHHEVLDVKGLGELDSRYLQISNNLSDINNAATARTNLGLVAGGAGDIWVEKAGDTMIGDLTFSGAFHPIVSPGSDADAVLTQVAVTGTPQMTWDESQDAFALSKPLDITAIKPAVNSTTSFQFQQSDGTNIFTIDTASPNLIFNGYLVKSAASTTNTVYGVRAGDAITSATNCTFIGEDAGGASNANNNTAVGRRALRVNTSGDSNMAVGGSALSSNTTASNNMAIGALSMRDNTTGGNNSGIGGSALLVNTTGSRNTAVGNNALNAMNGGDENVGIGASTGGAGNYSGCVFIGYQAGGQETASSKLYIANSNTTTPLIYGDFSSAYAIINGSLGIGTVGEPDSKLEVNGDLHVNDKIIFTQDDKNEFIDSLADGYMDYAATTAHRFNNNVNITGMMRQTTIWHAYGGFQGQNETIAISTVDTWTHVTNAGNDLWTGSEADGFTLASDVMTVTNTGDYVGNLSVTFHADNNKDFYFRVYNITQDKQEGYIVGATGMGANNLVNICLPLYLELTASDQLRVEVMCSTDASDPTVEDSVWYISYLHD